MKRFMIQRSKIRRHVGGAFSAGTVNRKVVDHFKFTDMLYYTRGQSRDSFSSVERDESLKRDLGYKISVRELGYDLMPNYKEIVRRNARRRFCRK